MMWLKVRGVGKGDEEDDRDCKGDGDSAIREDDDSSRELMRVQEGEKGFRDRPSVSIFAILYKRTPRIL